MTSSAGQGCCHLVGILVTIITIALAVGGLVLLIVFPEGENGHWVGIGVMIGAAVAALFTLIYSCFTLHKHWSLWGCINVSIPNSKLHRELSAKMGMSHEVSESVDSGGPSDVSSTRALAEVKRDSKPLDWDPDRVLPEKNNARDIEGQY